VKTRTTTALAAPGAAALATLALAVSAAPAPAATSFQRCSQPDGVARTMKVHGTTCRDGRAQAKAWQRRQGVEDQGTRFALRGYSCRLRSIRTSPEDPDGTAHLSCRTSTKRIVWTYHP
jgi:hypothetical protein